jgi:hypothetical protein
VNGGVGFAVDVIEERAVVGVGENWQALRGCDGGFRARRRQHGIILGDGERGVVGRNSGSRGIEVTKDQTPDVVNVATADRRVEINRPQGGAVSRRNVCHDECRMRKIEFQIESRILIGIDD